MKKLLMTLCIVSFSSQLLGQPQNSETEQYYDAVEQQDLHTPDIDDEEFFDSVEYLTSFNDLPHEMADHIAKFLHPSSLVDINQASREMNKIASPKLDDTNLSYLTDGEFIELAYKSNSKKIIQSATKNLLKEHLPTLKTDEEKLAVFQICDHFWFSIRDHVWVHVRDQVGDQVWDQVGVQVPDQVSDQLGAQFRDQVWDQVGNKVWDQVGIQVRDQVRDLVGNKVKDQVWDLVGNKVRDQVIGIILLYPNLVSSEEERKKFVNALIPVINKTISTYHYFYVKKLLEPSEDGSGTIFETIVDQLKNQIDEDNIDLAAIYNAATPEGWEELNQNIKNFLYPIQKYSQPDANS